MNKEKNEKNPICGDCGTEVRLATDADNTARWFCDKCKGFRKLHELTFQEA